MSQEPLWMQAMLDPRTYPHEVDRIRLIQTHISWIFIAADLVYKVKKPVDFGFLDFTTLEKRRHFCHEEIRLNRRLCPEIYLRAEPICRSGERIHLGQGDEILEWAVLMKRMPEEGMMPGLIQMNLVDEEKIGLITRRLIPFYERADRGQWVKEFGKIDVIRRNTEENFEQTKGFVKDIIGEAHYDKIVAYTREFLEKEEGLLLSRMDQGRIVEGHGDLYSANICFEPSTSDVYIFDCIEFNERFRCGDVASDVAFLAMDLDFHGLPVLAERFTASMSSGLGDADLLLVNDFYKCYRAYVRGKIGCFTWASGGMDEKTREDARNQATRYFKLALKYAGGLSEKAMMYVFFGLSGTGKSTLARAFAEEKGLAYYNSDVVRKEMVAGIRADEPRWEPVDQGIYAPGMTKRTYRALCRLAARHLMTGESVVLDATYKDLEMREELLEMARASGAEPHFILCSCPESVVRERLESRRKGGQVSDGRWEIYLAQKKGFHPTDHLPGKVLKRVDTTEPVKRLVEQIIELTEG